MTENEPPPTQMTCPRCGSARSKSATFCGTCGQDLRPGAAVIPLPPSSAPASATDAQSGAAKPRLPLLRRKPRPTEGGAASSAPGGAAAAPSTPATPGISATGPIMLPGSQTPLPKETPLPKPEPAVVPKADSTLSFSERYRGTQYGNPDIERFLPPAPGAKRSRRWVRILVVAIVFVATLAAALAGSWFLFLSPDAVIGPTAGPSRAATASATPRSSATPKPTIHGLIADEVEIAACLLLAEDAQQQDDLATLRTDVLGGGTPDVAARAAAVKAAIETSRSSLPTLDGATEVGPLAAAWTALYEIEMDALSQMAAGPADADALKAAVKRLDEAKAARTAVADAHAALVATFPEVSCVVRP